jgi:hypothetical protein
MAVEKETKELDNFGEASDKEVQETIAKMVKELAAIYNNKNSDEYKMSGDITKSQHYEKIESMIADLRTLKGFPKSEIQDYQALFNGLHKPLYKKMVTEYIKSPNEKNTTFTVIFTVGYRTLIGDLTRIYAATEATETGIVYHPDKAATQRGLTKTFIKSFTKNMDEEYNKAVRRINARPKMHQEFASALDVIGGGITALSAFSRAHELGPIAAMFRDIFNFIFGAKKDLNATSFINHQLTNSYDSLVKKFEDTEKMYNATKDAYEEYKNSGRQDPRIKANYERNIARYNVAMKTLQAKLDHFDSRAQEEAKAKAWQKRQEERAQGKPSTSKPAFPNPFKKPKPSSDTSSKPTDSDDTSTSTSSGDEKKPSPVDTGDLDF